MRKYKNLYTLFDKGDEDQILSIIIEYLKQYNIDDIDNNKNTLLLCAINDNKNKIVKYLIENGASVNGNRKTSYYPLEKAVVSENIEAIELLNIKNKLKYNRKTDFSIEYASAIGLYEVVKMLIENCAIFKQSKNKDMSALHLACQEGKLDVVKLLVENGANIDEMNIDGQTGLYQAAGWNYEDVVKYLIDNGANVDLAKDTTPLMIAFAFDAYKVIPILLKAGANINYKDDDGRTALFYAKVKKEIDRCNYLLEHGASLDIIDNYGISIKDLENEKIRKKLYKELF